MNNKAILVLLLTCFLVINCKKSTTTDISSIKPVTNDGYINAFIEIPAGTVEKWEVNKNTGTLYLEKINNKPRIINYLGYPANYGMIPNTLLPKNKGGDGDPLDIIVIGPPEKRGSVVKCKIIGVLHLMDNGEMDDKLIAISNNSTLTNINNISELETKFNGITKIISIWFTNYKQDVKLESNGYGNRKKAIQILEIATLKSS